MNAAGREEADRALAGQLPQLALDLLAVDPEGLGGICLRLGPGPETDEWLAAFRQALPEACPWRRLPLNIDDDRLLGGLDLAASLSAGKPLIASGLLTEAKDGVIVIPMAERLGRGTAARIAATIDQGAVQLERDGLTSRKETRFCVVALDEGREDDEGLSQDLEDRLALFIDGSHFAGRDTAVTAPSRARLDQARELLPNVQCDDERIAALVRGTLVLGIDSSRPALFALRAACAAAALDGRDAVNDEDLAIAAQLVLAPRVQQLPAAAQEEEPDAQEPPPEQDASDPAEQDPEQDSAEPDERDDKQQPEPPQGIPDELILQAVKSALPAGLIASLLKQGARRDLKARVARGGPPARALRRGRPIGVMPGDPRRGFRLHLPATLKSAAPWQKLRLTGDEARDARLQVRAEDFRVVRFKTRQQTTRIFVVDASGSAAAQRLAETKGAIELLLAESYATRDQVALIAFRGNSAELILPPTRALARAKRELAGLPGGGATPLAAGIHSAHALAADLQRKGQHPVLIFMTDGRANVCLDGRTGHQAAGEEALESARIIKSNGWDCLLVDTARRPRPKAREMAEAMAARYLPLPLGGAGGLSAVAAKMEASV